MNDATAAGTVCEDAGAAAAGVNVAAAPVPAGAGARGRSQLRLGSGANGFTATPAVGMLVGAAEEGGASGEAKLAQAMRVRLAKWMTKERLPT